MRPPRGIWLLLVLLLAGNVEAVQLWATWDLDLQGHAPPTQFVLTVTSATGGFVLPPLPVPWASCPSVPGAQHCAPVGCPPTGSYVFSVQAQFGEDLSDPSAVATCGIVSGACRCSQPGSPPVPGPAPAPAPAPVVSLPPTAPIPTPAPAPAGLILLPLGALPIAPDAPAIPARAAT